MTHSPEHDLNDNDIVTEGAGDADSTDGTDADSTDGTDAP